MAEYIDRDKIFPNKIFFANAENPLKSLDELIKRIWSIPAADVVSRATFEQVMWERDIAIQQLKDLGVGFGEKADVAPIVRCKECIHRESCQKQIVLWERDHVLEQNIYRYHKLGFCSYGVKRLK